MSEYISKLKSGNDKVQTLRSFQHWLSTCDTSTVTKTASDENINEFLDIFYEAGPEEIVLASEILHKLLSVVPVGTRIPRFQHNFLRGLEHKVPKIKEVILKELKVCVQDNSSVEHLAANPAFISQIAKLVGDESLTVATAGCEFLVSLGQHLETATVILTPPVSDVLNAVMSKSDVLKCRVYEVVMKMGGHSPNTLSLVTKNGFFEVLNRDLKGNDDLLLLNCLEVVKDLAVTDHGLKHLDEIGFMRAVGDMIVTSMEPPQSFIILPGILKFFMSIGESQPEYVFHQHNSVVQAIFNLVDGTDIVLLCIATDGIGLLGSSLRGKVLLQNEGKMPLALQSFQNNLQQGSSPEVKFHVIQALSNLLEVRENERNLNPEFKNILEGWLMYVSRDPGNMLFQLCRQPFLEIRHSALYLTHVVISHEWGQRIMVSVPGFVEYLLDRSTEGTIRGKEMKFKIVDSLVKSTTFNRIFDQETVDKILQYHHRGPFFVAAQHAVAVDEPL